MSGKTKSAEHVSRERSIAIRPNGRGGSVNRRLGGKQSRGKPEQRFMNVTGEREREVVSPPVDSVTTIPLRPGGLPLWLTFVSIPLIVITGTR